MVRRITGDGGENYYCGWWGELLWMVGRITVDGGENYWG